MPPLVDSVTTKRGSSDVLSPASAVDPLQTLKLLACRTIRRNDAQAAAGVYTSGNPLDWQSVGLTGEPRVPLRSLAFPCVPHSAQPLSSIKWMTCATWDFVNPRNSTTSPTRLLKLTVTRRLLAARRLRLDQQDRLD